MAYSLVGILAVVIHLIINVGVFIDMKTGRKFRGETWYFLFLISAIAFHITDGFWGFLYDAKMSTALFIDTTIYMVAMASSILLWGIFVSNYLGLQNKAKKILLSIYLTIFTFQIVVIFINFFYPVLFSVSPECEYSARPLRYANLALQILIYLLVSIYTFVSLRKVEGSDKRRYNIIGLFGIFMIVAITLQVFFPLLPFYSLGYLLGICVLHAFVFRDLLTESRSELAEAKHLVKIDPLTGVYSKNAYVEAWESLDKRIADKEINQVALVMFDLNDLKLINDTYGHDQGDKYLADSSKLISECFNNLPVYRVGGDEFVVIIYKVEYENRFKYLKAFNDQIDKNIKNHDRVIVSAGIGEYNPDKDTSILSIFTRADRAMYARKQQIKDLQSK